MWVIISKMKDTNEDDARYWGMQAGGDRLLICHESTGTNTTSAYAGVPPQPTENRILLINYVAVERTRRIIDLTQESIEAVWVHFGDTNLAKFTLENIRSRWDGMKNSILHIGERTSDFDVWPISQQATFPWSSAINLFRQNPTSPNSVSHLRVAHKIAKDHFGVKPILDLFFPLYVDAGTCLEAMGIGREMPDESWVEDITASIQATKAISPEYYFTIIEPIKNLDTNLNKKNLIAFQEWFKEKSKSYCEAHPSLWSAASTTPRDMGPTADGPLNPPWT